MSVPAFPHFPSEESVASPALVLHWDRIETNLRHMLALAGGPHRLRPHLKTHKLPQILRLQLSHGVQSCKAATIAEAEMAAGCGVPDVLLCAQPVGPAIERLLNLIGHFPNTRFSALCDCPEAANSLAAAARARALVLPLFLDLNLGQNRTGILPDSSAESLYHQIHSTPGIQCRGLHAYDGHLQQPNAAEREAACRAAIAPVLALRERLLSARLPVEETIAGGSPTFAFHAQDPSLTCSPGTTLLWDAGYASRFPELPFVPAATLLTRVISKPGANRLCLDLGHKAVASEMPQPRVVFPDLPSAVVLAHSEEHLVLETPEAASLPLGSVLHGIPWHICPTVALHGEVCVTRHSQPELEFWEVPARARRLRF
jgi:D-serine deaminase-like pyridoxal phosphate-dependent protein